MLKAGIQCHADIRAVDNDGSLEGLVSWHSYPYLRQYVCFLTWPEPPDIRPSRSMQEQFFA